MEILTCLVRGYTWPMVISGILLVLLLMGLALWGLYKWCVKMVKDRTKCDYTYGDIEPLPDETMKQANSIIEKLEMDLKDLKLVIGRMRNKKNIIAS